METLVRSELGRQRDLNKYYQPWLGSIPLKAVSDYNHAGQRPSAHSSNDTTLTALAQLAALRLNVKRAMVSLIDTTEQHLLAEATQTLSLVNESRHAPGDHIWLGQGTLPRGDCMEENVLGARWTPPEPEDQDQSYAALVVNDMTKDVRFQHRPYAQAEHGVKFYAAVPIVTKQGYEIGAYSVSDIKPRPEGLTLEEVLFMQDVAQIVAGHLERVKGSVDRERDELFVRGMSSFIEGLSTLKHNLNNPSRDIFDAVEDAVPDGKADVRATDAQDETERGRPGVVDSAQPNSSPSSPVADSGSGIDADRSATLSSSAREAEGPTSEPSDPSTNNVKQIFDRACKTILEGAHVQGCVFLDATSGLFSTRMRPAHSRESSVQRSHIGSDGSASDSDTDDENSFRSRRDSKMPAEAAIGISTSDAEHESDKVAKLLGFSVADTKSNINSKKLLKQKHLKRCLLRYPCGQCFYLDRGRVMSSHSSNSDETITGGGSNARTTMTRSSAVSATGAYQYVPRQLLDQIPNAKWLIFLPLFNYAQGQWFAAGFIWSDNSNVADLEAALPYLKAFGSCIMSEVSSMESVNTNLAKSTFIASISHDLRSPLHGLLGSLEFLEDTLTSAYQMSLVGSIETCGKTLLDTIDHLLDYAKINNLNRTLSDTGPNKARNSRSSTDGAKNSLFSSSLTTTTFDFAVLLEEVVEAVFAGQTFRRIKLREHDPVDTAMEKIRALGRDDSKSMEEQIHAGSAKFSGKVFFVLNIETRDSWCMRGQTGALRRVIMNIVGNAIKYCHVGSIEITLKAEQTSDSEANVHVSVNDTGVGMSRTFLQNHLFKAFSQEDSFTPGAGLGLSITSQIVQNLRGKIRVKSEKGRGTHVNISLPMGLAPGSCDDEQILQSAIRVTSGKQICLLNPTLDQQKSDQGQLSRLTASIARTCEEWFHMTCYQDKSVNETYNTAVYVYCEPPPIEYLLEHHSERKSAGKSGKEAALLIVCTNAFEAAALRTAGITHLTSLGRIIEVVSQPVGIRKLAAVLLQSLQRVEASFDQSSATPASNATKQSFIRSAEAQQRAATIEWNTSSTVYDQTVAKYRPSIQSFQWKSEQPQTTDNSRPTYAEGNETFGDIKAGLLPGLGSIPHRDAKAAAETGQPYVLVVDDNAINLKLLVTFMKKIKLPYAEAVNGLEAFNKFKEATERPFQFVLMDLQMPVMDGLESTRNIREYERETQTARPATIIAITGVGSESVRKEAMDAGMSQFVTKPVKFKLLQQLLEADQQQQSET